VKPAPFSYHRADSPEVAVALLAELGEDAKILAGGQSLVAMMNFRLARPSALVDVSRISDLRYLRLLDGGLEIGALTLHRDLEHLEDSFIAAGFGLLPQSARYVGHYAIRSAGTFGGSIAHADPAAEWCMLALLYDAEIVAESLRGERVIAAADFFRGFLETALAPDELITAVRLPRPWHRASLREFARRHGDFAIVAAATAVTLEDERCAEARVVLGGVGGVPVRVPAAEAALVGQRLSHTVVAEAARAAAEAIDPPSDLHGSAAYRRHLAGVLVRRSLEEALGDDR